MISLFSIDAQHIPLPVIDIKSHETLNIDSINTDDKQTVVFLSIENQLADGGWFCVDNTVIMTSNQWSDTLKMYKSSGIPNCPQLYQFKKLGEKLNFQLFFPKLPLGTKSIDIKENCNDNCFYFRNVSLDVNLNSYVRKFEDALKSFSMEDMNMALQKFQEIIKVTEYKNQKQYGYSLYIIPVIYQRLGLNKEAIIAYKQLLDSDIKDRDYLVGEIKKIDFFKNLDN